MMAPAPVIRQWWCPDCDRQLEGQYAWHTRADGPLGETCPSERLVELIYRLVEK